MVKVMWDVTTIEIYAEGRLVWTHDRKYDPYGYTTVKEHILLKGETLRHNRRRK